MSNQSDLQRILNQLLKVMDRNTPKFLKFCIDRGHPKHEIAKALGVSPTYISKLIKKYKLQDRERK